MKTDRELLELAAKAAGYSVCWHHANQCHMITEGATERKWLPNDDGGDALMLAVKLGMLIIIDREQEVSTVKWCASERVSEYWHWNGSQGADAATRRAITRAAAAIEEHMP